MTREEYLNGLRKYLRRLPPQDYADTMEYFTEYFEETDDAEAGRLMEELGTPKEAARELMRGLLEKKLEQNDTLEKPRQGWHIFRLMVLLLLAAPIGIPMLVALAAVLLSAAVCIACVVFCVFLFALCFLVVAGKLMIRGVLAAPFSVSGAAVIIGGGLLAVGAGLIGMVLGIYLCKWCAGLLVWLAHRVSTWRRKQA